MSAGAGDDPDDDLVVGRDGAVLVLRLNRPAASNALTGALLQGITRAVVAAEADPDTRVVVITGTGERTFCAGMDLRDFAGGGAPDAETTATFDRLTRGELTIPVVGAANGTAVGGGLELLLGCDIVVASSAARFGLPEVKRGLFPAGSGMLLGTRVPLGIALEIALTGDLVDAARAYEIGLVNAVVEPAEVLATALAYAQRVAENAPLGVAAIKELVRLGFHDVEAATQRLDHWRAVVFSSDDAREGAAAFVERRAPVWRGR